MEEIVLAELKERMERRLGDRLLRICLYGSRARGDYAADSDFDIAVIVRGLTSALKNQLLEDVADVEFSHLSPLSVLILSEDDFNRMKRRERRLALDIEREGIPV